MNPKTPQKARGDHRRPPSIIAAKNIALIVLVIKLFI
jgi:hypothetical protein